jgi:F0F1-type ATP synthase assembly protein I
MNQVDEPKEPIRSPFYTMGLVPLAVGGEVGCLTILIVGIALVAGIWLDRLMGTKPVFILIFLLGSAPFSLFLAFRVARRSVNQLLAAQSPVKTQAKPNKEEDTSE